MQEQGRQETGSSTSATYRAAESSGRWRAVPGMHHPQELHAQSLLRGARYDLGEARVRQDEGEPAVRGKEPGRRREELRESAGHLVPRRLLPRIRVSTPVSRPAVRRVRYHQVERTGLDPGNVPPKIPRHGNQPPVRAIVAEIPAREIEQVFLEIHAGAGKHRGGKARQEQQQDPAPCPEIENRAPAIVCGEPREYHGVDRETVPPLRLTDPKRRDIHTLLTHDISRGIPKCHARTAERTTQGGPRSEGRSCGTGEDLAPFEQRKSLRLKRVSEDWEMVAGYVCWAKTGSRDRMRPGTPPAEKRTSDGHHKRSWPLRYGRFAE